MKIIVIGGANIDISATTAGPFVAKDSNPGTVRTAPGGVGRNIAHNLALLGDDVSLITIFGDDGFGRMLKDNCKKLGIDTSLSETRRGARNACFVSINGSDGELLGGVADMAVTGLMTPEWLESRLPKINRADAVVADANIPADTLSFLVGSCLPPLYIDAVSSAKVARLREALHATRLEGDKVFAVKCNRLEAEVLLPQDGSFDSKVQRLYVSMGSEGVIIREDGEQTQLPALPATGIVNATGAGDALLAGIVHAGPDASAVDAARFGQECARCSLQSPEAVNDRIKQLANI
jgi:pseudouridine kinase